MKKYRNTVSIFTWNVLLPQLIGASIYVIWRSDSTFFANHLELLLASQRNFFLLALYSIYTLMPIWVINHLPDGLWAYSFMFLIIWLWETPDSKPAKMWIIFCALAIISYEFGQYLKWISGTFSWWDILFQNCGIILALFINYSYSHRLNNSEETVC